MNAVLNRIKRIVPGAISVALILSVTGCQTFTMSQADFEKQQAGKDVDPGVGKAVGATGSLAYLGYGIGSLLAGGSKK